MGLNVFVYKLEKIDEENPSDYDLYIKCIHEQYSSHIKNVKEGFYNATRIYRGVGHSYGTHSRFRKYLLKTVLVDRDDLFKDGKINWDNYILDYTLPFYNFINFSGCEGYIDWEMSSNIYNYFLFYDDIFKNNLNNKEYFRSLYERWMETFKIARDEQGAVCFF